MPVYSVLFGIFMLASIGLPGLSGFIGEFLVALATFQYSKWLALITFSVVILAAWYMMWMFQRVIFGRQPEDMPDPHDTELTPDEVARLERAGLLDGHGHWRMASRSPVSGASHDARDGAMTTHDIEWPDLEPDRAAGACCRWPC